MPVIKPLKGEPFPEWSELKKVDKFILSNGETIEVDVGFPKAAIFSFDGYVKITAEDGMEYELVSEGDVKDPSKKESAVLNSGKFKATCCTRPGYWMGQCEFYVFSGYMDWCSLEHFRVGPSPVTDGDGDATNYEVNTPFFNHYHDYDEYWLMARGGGIVQSEGNLYPISEGDVLATRRGDEHDFPIANSGYNKCIGFKSRMGGEGRIGFLLRCRDGEPVTTD